MLFGSGRAAYPHRPLGLRGNWWIEWGSNPQNDAFETPAFANYTIDPWRGREDLNLYRAGLESAVLPIKLRPLGRLLA